MVFRDFHGRRIAAGRCRGWWAGSTAGHQLAASRPFAGCQPAAAGHHSMPDYHPGQVSWLVGLPAACSRPPASQAGPPAMPASHPAKLPMADYHFGLVSSLVGSHAASQACQPAMPARHPAGLSSRAGVVAGGAPRSQPSRPASHAGQPSCRIILSGWCRGWWAQCGQTANLTGLPVLYI